MFRLLKNLIQKKCENNICKTRIEVNHCPHKIYEIKYQQAAKQVCDRILVCIWSLCYLLQENYLCLIFPLHITIETTNCDPMLPLQENYLCLIFPLHITIETTNCDPMQFFRKKNIF